MGLVAAKKHDRDVMAYYCAAVQERERERMPLTGPSVDRRALAMLQQVMNSESTKSLVCFVCAQIHTYLEVDAPGNWQIKYHSAAIFEHLEADSEKRGFLGQNCSLQEFIQRYARGSREQGNVFQNAPEFTETDWEWKRVFLWSRQGKPPLLLLCCPEDVAHCGRDHARHALCRRCEVPLCFHCFLGLQPKTAHAIPMALGNDNFWGYTSDIIAKYQVRWIEAAIVSPCWTAMLVYYVEGDWGHLMQEEFQAQKYRTLVKGSCFSFHMPWEDILGSLQETCRDQDLTQLPWPQECLNGFRQPIQSI